MDSADAKLPPRRSIGVLYPTQYVWFVFFSAMDVMMTWIVLWHGGREVNHWANTILQRWGLTGLVIFKFALVIVIILICEAVGHRHRAAGKKLATAAIAITCLPVALSFVLLHL
jgi:hypothetical protein